MNHTQDNTSQLALPHSRLTMIIQCTVKRCGLIKSYARTSIHNILHYKCHQKFPGIHGPYKLIMTGKNDFVIQNQCCTKRTGIMREKMLKDKVYVNNLHMVNTEENT